MDNRNSLVIGVSGGSGSGKTTLVNELGNAFPQEQVIVVRQDDYYWPREHQRKDEKGVRNFDLPTSINDEQFQQDLHALLRGESVTYATYTFNNNLESSEVKTIHPAPIILVEGLFIYHFEAIQKLLDLRVFVEADSAHKVTRRITRDQNERNYPFEDVVYRYQNHVLPSYKKYILPHRERADIIVNNNTHMHKATEVLKGYMNMYLHQLKDNLIAD